MDADRLANLSTIPLRTEYLGNPIYGQNYDSGTILLIVSVIADCLTLASMMMWAPLRPHEFPGVAHYY